MQALNYACTCICFPPKTILHWNSFFVCFVFFWQNRLLATSPLWWFTTFNTTSTSVSPQHVFSETIQRVLSLPWLFLNCNQVTKPCAARTAICFWALSEYCLLSSSDLILQPRLKALKIAQGEKRHASNPSLLQAAVHLCEQLNAGLEQKAFPMNAVHINNTNCLLPHLPSALSNHCCSLIALLAMDIIIKFFLIPLSLCWSSLGCERSRASARFQLGAVFLLTGISILKVHRVK